MLKSISLILLFILELNAQQIISGRRLKYWAGLGITIPQVQLYAVHEREFTATGTYANAYIEVDTADVIITYPSTEYVDTLPMFWDGGDSWKFRFSPDTLGLYTYVINSTDAGLDGETGSFNAISSSNKGSLVADASYPYHFKYQNGDRIWFLGDTQWNLFRTITYDSLNTETVKDYIDLRASQGYNIVHFVTNTDEQWLDVEQNDMDTLNLTFFQNGDERLAYLNSKGLIGGLLISWASEKGDGTWRDWENFGSQADRVRYIKYVIARYSAYNIYWILAGEYSEAPSIDFDSLGTELARYDPHGRMIAVHTTHTSEEFADASWSGFGDYQQRWDILEDLHDYASGARDHSKPVVNSEYAYYMCDRDSNGQVDYSDEIMPWTRRQAWNIAMSGSYFLTGYGATVLGGLRHDWAFTDMTSPIYDDWEEQVGYIKSFFQNFDYWTLNDTIDYYATSTGTHHVLSDTDLENMIVYAYNANSTAVTDTFVIADSTDDGYVISTGLFDRSDEGVMTFGNFGDDYYHTFTRFPNVTIPQGAVINSAKIYFTANGDRTDLTCNTNVYFNDTVNSAATSSYADYVSRAVTEAVSWSNVEAWYDAGVYTSPEIKQALQEVIDLPGWTSGNAVQAFVKNSSSTIDARRRASSYSTASSTNLAYLIVNYTASGGGSSVDLDLSSVPDTFYNIRRYDPTDGSYTNIGTYQGGSTVELAVPDTNDWAWEIKKTIPAAYITVTAPNGGETINHNTYYNITWTDNISGNVKIELYKNGVLIYNVQANTPSDGSFDGFRFPSGVGTGADYAIRITSVTDGSVMDSSDAWFTVDVEGAGEGGSSDYESVVYVSPWGGGDTLTIADAINYSFVATDTMVFLAGYEYKVTSTWTLSTSNIALDRYGSGADPIISMMDSISGAKNGANWTDDGGNLWHITLTSSALYGTEGISRLWLSGVEYPRAVNEVGGDNRDDLSGIPTTYGVNSLHRYFHWWEADELYVYATSNPASYYSSFTYCGGYPSVHYYVIKIENADYVSIRNLEVRGGVYSPIKFNNADYAKVDSCKLWGGQHANIDMDYSNYFQISNNNLDNHREVKVNFYDGTVEYNVVAENSSYGNVYGNFIKNHNFAMLFFNGSYDINFYSNEITAPDIEYGKSWQIGGLNQVGYTGGHRLYNNYIHNSPMGCQIGSGDEVYGRIGNIKIYYNVYDTLTLSENSHTSQGNSGWAILVTTQGEQDSVWFFNNTVKNTNNKGFVDEQDRDVWMFNNLFVNNATQVSNPPMGQVSQYSKGGWKNNLIWRTDLTSASSVVRIVSDYTISNFNLADGTYTNMEISGNLQYVNASSSALINSDYTLPSGSTALNAGIDVQTLLGSVTTDREGNSITDSAPNLGAINNVP